MRTWTTRPTPSANNGYLDCTWPRVGLPLNPPPIDRPIPPQSRKGWENDDVEVYATYTPNPVATRVELFSKESYEHGQNVAPRLNCLRLWDRGNGQATVVIHLAFFLSFLVPYLPTVIPQGLYGGYTMWVRLLNASIPSPGTRVWFQPQH